MMTSFTLPIAILREFCVSPGGNGLLPRCPGVGRLEQDFAGLRVDPRPLQQEFERNAGPLRGAHSTQLPLGTFYLGNQEDTAVSCTLQRTQKP